MLRRNYLGLEICRNAMRAISIQRRGAGAALLGGQTLTLSDGVVSPVAQEPNILNPEQFVEAVREVLMPLAKREDRVAVVLPDAAGHVFLIDIDTPFKNRSEGEDIVRWHLKDLLPGQIERVAVDYQIIEERESGSRRVLVSLMAQEVLQQYESLLHKAGFLPALIDFHALNLYSAYRPRIDLGHDFILIGVDGKQLSMLAFQNRLLDFYRIKSTTADPERIFQELNRSMVGYRRAHTSFARSTVYLHTDWREQDGLIEAVKSAFDREVELLPSPLHHLIGHEKLSISASEASGMAAAFGAAERMIQRVG